MELPDFLEFEAFNRLRQTMGAEALGDFVFFDPHKHLTGLEVLELGKMGIVCTSEQLRGLGDFTLAFKNARVLTYCLNQAQQPVGHYHLADCGQVQQWWEGETVEVQVAFLAPEHMPVCQECLHRLRYQGFNNRRTRHQDYTDQLVQSFDLQVFFQKYPNYPIEESQAPVF